MKSSTGEQMRVGRLERELLQREVLHRAEVRGLAGPSVGRARGPAGARAAQTRRVVHGRAAGRSGRAAAARRAGRERLRGGGAGGELELALERLQRELGAHRLFGEHVVALLAERVLVQCVPDEARLQERDRGPLARVAATREAVHVRQQPVDQLGA